jgi:hypothetical protein
MFYFKKQLQSQISSNNDKLIRESLQFMNVRDKLLYQIVEYHKVMNQFDTYQ